MKQYSDQDSVELNDVIESIAGVQNNEKSLLEDSLFSPPSDYQRASQAGCAWLCVKL